jgi:GNAT superfamily N-acetyltransferase
MHAPMSWEVFQRIPRHPDWRWEYWDGEVHLSHRPRPLELVRTTAEAVGPADDRPVAYVTPTSSRDELTAFLWDVWQHEDPYRTYDIDEARRLLEDEVARYETTLADPAGVVMRHDDALIGALLLYDWDGDGAVMAWLSVHAEHRLTGVATTLLGAALAGLREAGSTHLRSFVSPANLPSVRWHWRRRFAPVAHADAVYRLQARLAGSSPSA